MGDFFSKAEQSAEDLVSLPSLLYDILLYGSIAVVGVIVLIGISMAINTVSTNEAVLPATVGEASKGIASAAMMM